MKEIMNGSAPAICSRNTSVSTCKRSACMARLRVTMESSRKVMVPPANSSSVSDPPKVEGSLAISSVRPSKRISPSSVPIFRMANLNWSNVTDPSALFHTALKPKSASISSYPNDSSRVRARRFSIREVENLRPAISSPTVAGM